MDRSSLVVHYTFHCRPHSANIWSICIPIHFPGAVCDRSPYLLDNLRLETGQEKLEQVSNSNRSCFI
jgi:hypothetical protein